MVFFNKVKFIYRSYFADNETKKFIEHNQKIWGNHDFTEEAQNGKILFELNDISANTLASSYLANTLKGKFNSELVGYNLKTPGWRRFFYFFLPVSERIYRSFGVSKIINVKLDKFLQSQSDTLYLRVYPFLKTKRKVEDLTIDGVLIGDLVYDEYLRSNNKPTIYIDSSDFSTSLKKSLDIYIFWKNYFEKNKVKAINVSHCVYNQAIPLRIAINKNIDAFQVSPVSIYRLNKGNMFAYTDFINYKYNFFKLPVDTQSHAIELAKNRIDLRFKGCVGVDMPYSSKSAYLPVKTEGLIKKSNKIKVFVALHCFFDSPHSYGNNLFTDFYVWLNFLGEISHQKKYDWYLKTHPDFLPGNLEIIDEFLKKYPKFNLLPSDYSHHQIIKEGVDVALTTYGTIGFEYAALGVPVINASLNNPHIAFNFNLNPKNIEEYKDLLLNLDKLDLNIDLNEVYQFYYMRYMNKFDTWLFDDYESIRLAAGSQAIAPKIYSLWMESFDYKKHIERVKFINIFLESSSFLLEESCFKKEGV